jgi:hypothetical protein
VDFNTFVIAGPNTVTNTVGVTVFGEPVSTAAAGATVTQETQCSTDQVSILSNSIFPILHIFVRFSYKYL